MLNHPFYHPDQPSGSQDQDENPGEGSVEESTPTAIEIGGERYTEDQIESALSGLEAVEAAQREQQAAYTRQTQDIAAKRREVEEMEARAKDLLSKAEQEFAGNNPLDDTVPGLGQELDSIKGQLSQLTQAQQAEAEARSQREAQAQHEQAMQAALSTLDGRPYIVGPNQESEKAAIRAYMEQNNLGPQHVNLAYNARYGAQIGEQRGFQRAVREGVQAGPPQMGAGQTSISPGFTTPQEAPGAEVDVSQKSWDDVGRDALNDPNKPKFA